jgi:hypothetical protein
LYVVRRARQAELDTTTPDWGRLSSEIRRTHRRATGALQALPERVQACGVDSG